MGAKSSVKLAYKMFLASIFTSDGHPMLLVWLKTTQEDASSEQLQNLNKKRGKQMESKKLFRSNNNRMLCGVCGGIGEYLNFDPTLIRLIWAVFACSGMGILVYFLAAIIIPTSQEF